MSVSVVYSVSRLGFSTSVLSSTEITISFNVMNVSEANYKKNAAERKMMVSQYVGLGFSKTRFKRYFLCTSTVVHVFNKQMQILAQGKFQNHTKPRLSWLYLLCSAQHGTQPMVKFLPGYVTMRTSFAVLNLVECNVSTTCKCLTFNFHVSHKTLF